MTGLICLQGGHEFDPDCFDIDTDVLAGVGDGPVAILAGAARVGDDYANASRRATRYYEGLGRHVVTIDDPRVDRDAAVAGMTDDIALVVLPGGSPSNLLECLEGPVGDRLLELLDAGTGISGASAGAMVLCERVVRPAARGGADVVCGLGVVEGLALPHWSRRETRNWPLPDDVVRWGLPECGGVIFAERGADPRASGFGEPSRFADGEWVAIRR